MSLLDTVWITCPYCGEPNEIVIDTSVSEQSYIEDCTVCCRPMVLHVCVDELGLPSVEVRDENE